jgi:transcriptional regulator with XRE-family HTH domain
LDEIPGRIREALQHRKINQSELARRTDVRPGTISSILSGEKVPTVETLAAICNALKVYPSWIMLGEGPKYVTDSGDGFAPVVLSDGKTAPIRTHGVDQWLAQTTTELTEDESAWMRAIPWPAAHIQQPDLVYLTMLSVYRQARQAQPPSIAAAPPARVLPDRNKVRP